MAAGGGVNKATTTTKRKRRKRSKSKIKSTNILLQNDHPHRSSSGRHENITAVIPHLIAATSDSYSFLLNHDLHLLPSQTIFLESLLSSTSSSLSKLLSFHSISPHSLPPEPAPVPPPPAQCWFQRFLSSASADYDSRWSHFFNLSKPSFTLLLRLLTPSLSSLSPLPPNYALASALFRLAHSASFSAVARRFNMDSATACRAFYTVCKGINDRLCHLFEFKSDINRVIVGFGWISLPNCCGALGLERFQLDVDLLDENGSLIVQALVDSEGRFLDVSAGWPSTVAPSSILRQSKFFSGVEESKEYLQGPSFELSDGNSIPQYILGDSCFPLLPWLLTPYKKSDENDESSSPERAFNSVHNGGMEIVKMAFGRVRNKWKLVARKWKENCIEAFPYVIVTCCLLHNFLIKCSESLPDENVEVSKDEKFPIFDGEEDESGKKTRDALASHLSRTSLRR